MEGIEETLYGLKDRYTMLLVTRSVMQQASRIPIKLPFSWMAVDWKYNDTNEMFLDPTKKKRRLCLW